MSAFTWTGQIFHTTSVIDTTQGISNVLKSSGLYPNRSSLPWISHISTANNPLVSKGIYEPPISIIPSKITRNNTIDITKCVIHKSESHTKMPPGSPSLLNLFAVWFGLRYELCIEPLRKPQRKNSILITSISWNDVFVSLSVLSDNHICIYIHTFESNQRYY